VGGRATQPRCADSQGDRRSHRQADHPYYLQSFTRRSYRRCRRFSADARSSSRTRRTRKLLARDNDPNRPLPTVTFGDTYTLKVGGETLELSYHGNGHEPGNIFIYAPEQKTLMVVDVIFPGWMMWRRFALAQDIPGFFDQVEKIKTFDFEASLPVPSRARARGPMSTCKA